jgi:hypothetical protein
VLLQIRIRLEEAYLLGVHGEAFAEYCRRTPRWLLGRRRVPGTDARGASAVRGPAP